MRFGIRKFIRDIYAIRREKTFIPVEHRPSSGHEFDGKTAWISGGSGGIGLAIVKTLLASGCNVIISGTNKKKLDDIEHNIVSDRVKTLLLDYQDTKLFREKVLEATKLFNQDIEIFVSVTGIHIDRDGLDFLNVTEKEYDSIMEVNLKGTYFMCQNVAQYMIENKIKGHILIVSSQSALEPSWSPYRLSKLGIAGITKGMAQRLLQYGIIVNGIGPGPTATSMQKNYDGNNIYTTLNPIERYTMSEEVAEFAKMMVSPLGNTIVGDTLYMSGGRGIIEIR